ncbi:PREDICTED: phorbol-12-myristate-13-acetate-induced protein 1-like [Tinamus guttatus]|uniref:phorbol-12-myristate-13-acetate-induced protein 1-like n=1 Tax=Tinamus guttatus TaxID=94827 RepID=UPI00052EE63E|nr:PREDICTED: phorbol-12-myristate-13-acetate-induced protein 1-like [Tinamus guttatus]
MLPGGTARHTAPSAATADQEVVAECAEQLRRIGDEWNLRQRLLNLLMKLMCLERWTADGGVCTTPGLSQLGRKP